MQDFTCYHTNLLLSTPETPKEKPAFFTKTALRGHAILDLCGKFIISQFFPFVNKIPKVF